MEISREQRAHWTERTAQSPFNLWLADRTRGADGRLDLDRLYTLAAEYGVDARGDYPDLNPGQQRMNVGNRLRARVPAEAYAAYSADRGEPQVFGTWFWGFDPTGHPFAGFTHAGSRDALIARSRPGDLILAVGTQGEPTVEESRGRALGLIEFVRSPMNAEDLIPPGTELPDRLFENGVFKWPHAVPAARAWLFPDKPRIRDVIGRQLTSAAITGTDKLSSDEVARILELEIEEVDLPPSAAALKQQRLHSAKPKLDATSPGQPGPPPSEWSALVAREDGPTATYLMRFGKSTCWKIGISQNVLLRRQALNFSVPSEVLDGECWEVVLTHTWPNGAPAYQMEQILLRHLSAYGTSNERVRAPEGVVYAAWQDFLLGRLA
ncbi:hypothetical protein IWC96_12745 [Brevundimonas sp. BAL450]|uniref:hypothetical protein n=1 Tax=Brevundimonas TaxID=41275 RepID=UPI0011D23C86|nr:MULTISPECIES: hypothetical protein [Brevundimonas]MBG7616138.1 hypothetical protein [Brevundimonas sp. BAL450]